MKPLLLIWLVTSVFVAKGNTIVVGKGGNVPTIRAGIAMAENGDTVQVLPGLYKEGHLTITKSIVLAGKGRPVLDGENKYEILLVSGTKITITGFVFRNSGYSAMNDFASVKVVDARNILIADNQITGAYFAIHISNTAGAIVRGNTIIGTPRTEQLTGNAIHLWKSSDALIENNHVQGHRDGIYFEFVTHSVIRNNISEKNIRYGLHFMFSNDDMYQHNTFSNNGAGVAVMYSSKVKMERNLFEENWGPSAYGILLKDITDSYIFHNTFRRNTMALHLEGSSRIDIRYNRFSENGWAIKVQASCDNNQFHHNNFTGNSFDVGTNGSISLNNFYNNYWDKYEGYDINHDGIGDIAYHPVSMYSMIVEQNPATLMLFRSFTVQLIDKAEKAIPSLTPENLTDTKPFMKPVQL